MSPKDIEITVSNEMEAYSVIISSQPTDDGKIEWKASVEWNGQEVRKSPWSRITDAHVASLTMLLEIHSKLTASVRLQMAVRLQVVP